MSANNKNRKLFSRIGSFSYGFKTCSTCATSFIVKDQFKYRKLNLDSTGIVKRQTKRQAGDQSPGSTFELTDPDEVVLMDPIDHDRCRYPFCIVWTPIPVLSWIFPFLGHMGICMSSGVIRDFAGPYFVSEDLMAFGNPTKYWQLCPQRAVNGQAGWDAAVYEASEIYKKRMHILCYDNCHSHVATALNLMSYDGCKNWNMVKLAFYMLIYSKYVSFWAFLKTWIPFIIIVAFIVGLAALI